MADTSAVEKQMHIQTQGSAPDWVTEMHLHFQDHGFYRPEDLERVLGDPRTQVEVQVSSGSATNLIITK